MNVVQIIQVDVELEKMWRSITVDAKDDAKIDEYLREQGNNKHLIIECAVLMSTLTCSYLRIMFFFTFEVFVRWRIGPKKPLIPKRKKPTQKKRQFEKPRDNEHLADVPEAYEDNTITIAGAKISAK